MSDNFFINGKEGNSEGQDFWIVCCTKLLHTLTKPLKCKWGTDYSKGDEVVAWKYYQKRGNSNSFYVLLKDSNVVYLFSHVVKSMKL